MAENEELKPCPFCGYALIHVLPGSTFRWRYAQCGRCEACAGEVRIQTSGDRTPDEWEQEARIQAIKEWNTRATVNPWRYVERDGNPVEAGQWYLVAWQPHPAVSDKCYQQVDKWTARGWDECWKLPIYAYRLLPEPPPLEPEGEES